MTPFFPQTSIVRRQSSSNIGITTRKKIALATQNKDTSHHVKRRWLGETTRRPARGNIHARYKYKKIALTGLEVLRSLDAAETLVDDVDLALVEVGCDAGYDWYLKIGDGTCQDACGWA